MNGTRTSLCCECGTPRTVSDNYAPRGDYTYRMGWTPEEIERCRRAKPDSPYYAELRPWIGGLERLKCATCKTQTDHAIVPDYPGDPCEEANNAGVRAWQRARAVAEDIVMLTGARLEWCERVSCPPGIAAQLSQYLDDGEWFLTVFEGHDADMVTSALEWLYKAILTPDTRWFVLGPDPIDADRVPFRALAYGER